jgi:hypothetical protein
MNEVLGLIDQQRNPYFSAEAFGAELDRMLRSAALASVHEDFSMSERDIEELRSARDAAVSRTASTLDSLIEMAEQRRGNLVRYRHLNFVSLGLDCMARTFPTRWGMKWPAKLGEHSGPFDLAIHMPDVVEELLTSGFADYLTPEHLEFDPSLNYCVNRQKKISFNHEVGEEYSLDGFRKLREVYEARIDRFPSMLADPRPLVLIVGYPPFFGANRRALEGFRRIHERISERRSAPTVMYCFRVHQPSKDPEINDFFESAFAWANFAMPSDDYVWHAPGCFLSKEGMEFEHSIITSLQQMIEREQLLT